MRRSLAICIPTYNRCEIVEDTLLRELDICKNLGIDIYLYDSSSDGKTRKLMEKYQAYPNLFYIQVESDVKLDQKVVMLFQRYKRQRKYDYMWLVGDSISFSEELLKKIIDAIQTSPTMVFINNEDLQHLGNTEYYQVQELFKKLFWKSTLWGSIIVKESLYDGVDWKLYEDLFVGLDQISVGLHWYRLAQEKEFRAILFSVRKGIDVKKSSLKKFAWWKEKECGSETVYRVWAEGLVETAYRLPFEKCDIETALGTCRDYMQIFNKLNLCRSRKDEVYNLSIYKKYRKGIKILSGYSDITLKLIAVMPIIPMKVIVRLCDKKNEFKRALT